jgi:outer membrane protein TolC
MMRWLQALVLLGAASTASAQQLTVHDAVTAVLGQHPSLARASAAVAEAAAGVRETNASLLPAATVDGMAVRYQEPMVVAPLHGFDITRPPVFDRTLLQASIGLAWTAFDGGARGARGTRSRSEHEAARAGLDVTLERMLAETVRAYGALAAARDVVGAQRARVAALARERERAGQLLAEGRAARVVLLRAEAALSGARAELAAAEGDADVAARDLARLMAVEPGAIAATELAPLAVRADDLERSRLLQRAVQASPDLRRLRAAVAARDAAIAEAAALQWPRVQVGGRYVQYASGAGDAGREWQAGVQLSYPLFTGGARPAAHARARAGRAQAAADLALGEQRAAAAIDRALSALMAADARTAAWQAAVDQGEEVVRMEQLALDTGGGVQTDYLAAHAELLRARAALAQARFAAVMARVDLASATGDLTPAWLAENVESVP